MPCSHTTALDIRRMPRRQATALDSKKRETAACGLDLNFSSTRFFRARCICGRATSETKETRNLLLCPTSEVETRYLVSPVSETKKRGYLLSLTSQTKQTQTMCYIGLWAVSGNHPTSFTDGGNQNLWVDDDTNITPAPTTVDDISTDETPDFSIFAVAGAMYLLLSIAAADLWGACALCFEDFGSDRFEWFTQRRAFGLFLLSTFVTLVGASIRILFYSSFEDVELIIGAAAVLFVADVDEKVMVVLKNVTGKWRLFWVLEGIGLSTLLAVFAIKVTENAKQVAKYNDKYSQVDNLYGWFFILSSYPVTITVCALMLSNAASMPKSSLAGRLLWPACLPGWFSFRVLVYCWLIVGVLEQGYIFLDSFLVYDLPLHSVFLALCACCCYGICFKRWELTTHLIADWNRFNRTVDRRPRKYLLRGGLAILVTRLGIHALVMPIFSEEYVLKDVLDVLGALVSVALEGWLILGMLSAGKRAAPGHVPEPPLKWMLLGWCLSEGSTACSGFVNLLEPLSGLFEIAGLIWTLILGTLLWGEEPGTYGVAFWAVATRVRTTVSISVSTWIFAWTFGTVK